MKVIKNVRLRGEITSIGVDDGKIVAIEKNLDGEGVDFGGAEIYPGLIDTHSHGCVGEDTIGGNIAKMARWQLASGVTTYYPTTTTVSREDIIKATEANIENILRDNEYYISSYPLRGVFGEDDAAVCEIARSLGMNSLQVVGE